MIMLQYIAIHPLLFTMIDLLGCYIIQFQTIWIGKLDDS